MPRGPGVDAQKPTQTLDVGRVFANQSLADMKNHWLDVALGELHFAETMNAFVGGDADDRVLADDGASQISDFHGRCPYLRNMSALRMEGMARL
jgi:hypothetical protein